MEWIEEERELIDGGKQFRNQLMSGMTKGAEWSREEQSGQRNALAEGINEIKWN